MRYGLRCPNCGHQYSYEDTQKANEGVPDKWEHCPLCTWQEKFVEFIQAITQNGIKIKADEK